MQLFSGNCTEFWTKAKTSVIFTKLNLDEVQFATSLF